MTLPLFFNPNAGQGLLQQRLEQLADRFDVELRPIDSPDTLARLLNDLPRDQRVLVAGGDGTLHRWLPALLQHPGPIALLPGGTGNDFHHALGVRPDLEQALADAVDAEAQSVDLGRVNDVPFAGIAGIGLVAEVLDYIESRPRRFRGAWVYPWAVIRTLLRFRPLHVTVESDGGRFNGAALLALVANSPRFGGGMRVVPAAKLDDGQLDVAILKPVGRLAMLPLLRKVYRGDHVDHPAFVSFRCRKATLTTQKSAAVYADGEALGLDAQATVSIEALPNAIRCVR